MSGMKIASTTFGNTRLTQRKLTKLSRIGMYSAEDAEEHITYWAGAIVADICLLYSHANPRVIIELSPRGHDHGGTPVVKKEDEIDATITEVQLYEG